MFWTLLHPGGVDSSDHVRFNTSVKGVLILWGISKHSVHKEEVLFFSSVYIKKGY